MNLYFELRQDPVRKKGSKRYSSPYLCRGDIQYIQEGLQVKGFCHQAAIQTLDFRPQTPDFPLVKSKAIFAAPSDV
jgi:hypothetical protein